ncbi:hypothetical protein MNB_SV-13-304 [hydrothermal vent metagenome]|uniref:Uncharacterized protein n=1 Tax=hydrothermal vent metagenome TaxID=652676 RepID=A0A1W1CY06_9ZZZZ
MRGRVLIYDNDTKRGVIKDNKNNKYDFHIGEWLSEESIVVGKEVNFEIPREDAINIDVKKRRNFVKVFVEWGKSFFEFVCRGRD